MKHRLKKEIRVCKVVISITATLLFTVFTNPISAQQLPAKQYEFFIKKADSLYIKHHHHSAALAYNSAFISFGNKGYLDDRYKAARAWALAGVDNEAFLNLNKLVKVNFFTEANTLITDTALKSLHSNVRWSVLLRKVQKREHFLKEHYNPFLSKTIDSLATTDQQLRQGKYNVYNTLPALEYAKKLYTTDSLHYIKLVEIFNKFGYPGFSIVGEISANNFWLLVQHQNNHPQFQCKVLSSLKKSIRNKNASKSNYAYLRDRVNINANKLQVYGTQVELNSDSSSFLPKPTLAPHKINRRRQKMGLSPIEQYIAEVNSLYATNLKNKCSP
jgi:hypothetical protein